MHAIRVCMTCNTKGEVLRLSQLFGSGSLDSIVYLIDIGSSLVLLHLYQVSAYVDGTIVHGNG